MVNVQLASSCLILTSLVFSSAAMANQCDELHPTTDDDYYHLDLPAVDSSTTNQLRDFASKLDGRWRGSALEIECGISDGENLSSVRNYELDAEISQHFLGAIIVRAEKDSPRKRSLDKIFLSPEIDKQRQGKKIGYRSYSVEFSDANTMVFNEKYRVHNNGPLVEFRDARHVNRQRPVFQRMVHEVKSVKLENNKLHINRDLYVNGHFVSQQEWTLTRH